MISTLLFAAAHTTLARAEASDRQAYEAAKKCYVVAAHAAGERERAGDKDKSAFYESKAHAAFDMASKFGQTAGLTGQQISRDIEATQDREIRKLVPDEAYFRQSAANCKALGLL